MSHPPMTTAYRWGMASHMGTTALDLMGMTTQETTLTHLCAQSTTYRSFQTTPQGQPVPASRAMEEGVVVARVARCYSWTKQNLLQSLFWPDYLAESSFLRCLTPVMYVKHWQPLTQMDGRMQ